MSLTIHKMHGAGNDIVIVDLRRSDRRISSDWAKRWGDRKTGIGFDQALALYSSERDSIAASVDIWNADGSPAEQCGNGMRCLGLYLSRADFPSAQTITVQGPVADIDISCQGKGQAHHESGVEEQVTVDMGLAAFEPSEIPMQPMPRTDDGWIAAEIDGATVKLGAVSMGNPHVIVACPDSAAAPLETQGRAIAALTQFPQSCNVGYVQILDRANINLRVLERGAGETRACGSGACAAVAWLQHCNQVDATVRVNQAGGSLIIEIKPDSGRVMLTGPAVYVFEGTIE